VSALHGRARRGAAGGRPARPLAAGLAALVASSVFASALQQDAPPGEAAEPVDRREALLPAVDALIARHDCLACHAPERAERAALDPTAPPILADLGARVAPAWVTEFLADPRATRPGTPHPHQLVALPEASRRQVALDLTHYLVGESAAAPAPAPPATVADVERGRAVYHAVGCVACHGPREDADDFGYSLAELAARDPESAAQDAAAADPPDEEPARPSSALAPDFEAIPGDLARKYEVAGLAAFLRDPVAVRPSGHCPSMSLTPREATSVALYLLLPQAQRLDGSFEVRPGLVRLTYEIDADIGDPLGALDALTPTARGTALAIDLASTPRDDEYALRFTGWLDVPEDGEYTFHLRSDDGSRLLVDGEVVIDNDGVHPPTTKSAAVDLYAGKRAIVVDMFERAGGAELGLEWEGPGVERGPLPPERLTHWPLVFERDGDGAAAPFALDSTRASRGAQAFRELGCAACHADAPGVAGLEPPRAPRLAQLTGSRPGVLVCLRPDGRYDLAPEDAGALLSAFVEPSSIAADALVPERAIERTMVRRRCYACHRRGDVGGVHPDIAPFFQGDEDAELGDQGRFPPVLTAVGRKLRPEVLEAAVHGHERVRPYLSTRMPEVGDANLARLADLLRSVDEAAAPPDLGPCGPSQVEEGRRLAGVRGGLGCVQCHDFRGTRSLGVRAVDLGEMHRRLRYGWFRELLLDPSSVDLEARMASFWIDGESPVADIAGGDREAQIARLWCWLGEGDDMAPPPGLDTGPWAFEVLPEGRTRLVSVFMRDVSPRVVCMGTPEGVHAAFDVVGGRVAYLWRGRFLNAMGTWKGRAGALESPGSDDRFDVPPGPAILARESLVAPWSTGVPARATAREVHGDGAVSFEYTVGDLEVRETLRPVEIADPTGGGEARTGMRRTFRVRAPAGGVGRPVVARIATARAFRPAGRGAWHVGAEDWPVARVLGDAARTAKVVRPRLEPVGDGDAVLVDGGRRARENGGAADGARAEEEELRVPVLLRPDRAGLAPGADPRRAPLVGEIEWEVAW